MSTIRVTNKTKLPIHCATQWAHIVQEFRNGVKPGDTIELPAAGFGWQDFVAVTGTPDNEISHREDWKRVMEIASTTLGTVAAIAAVVAIPLTGGASAVLATGAWAVATVGGGAAAGAAAAVGGLGVLVGDFALYPTIVPGLWGPDGYEMVVEGGDIQVTTPGADPKQIQITNVDPLKVRWKNLKSGTTGVSISTR